MPPVKPGAPIPATLTALMGGRAAQDPDTPYFHLFDEAVTYGRLWRESARYAAGLRRAGIDPAKVTPHVFRHTFATELLDEGFTIRQVQEALRHADVSTTMIYTHVLDADLRDKIQRRRRG